MKPWIIFTDSGDTIVDEGTQEFDENGDVTRAELIPGAREAMLKLYESGHIIALVADGTEKSFSNVFAQHGLRHIFSAWVVSETLGTHKPDAAMFREAARQLNMPEEDFSRTVMVGNNMKRDIRGANALGIRSVLLKWSDRYDYTPQTPLDVPTDTISSPTELVALIARLEGAQTNGNRACPQ